MSPAQPEPVSGAALAARSVFDTLLALGLSDVVVCPGSRSQALALEAAAAEREGLVRLHVAADERSGAFFALGAGRETLRPAAVIVTSGSAVGNLLPAVMEAHAGRVPLLLITADRPPELHGMRANQTIQQAGIFAPFVRDAADIAVPALLPLNAPLTPDWSAATSAPTPQPELNELQEIAARLWHAACGTVGAAAAGPAHFNLGLRDPLAAPLPPRPALAAAPDTSAASAGVGASAAPAPDETPDCYVLDSDKRTVILAGADACAAAGAAALELAAAARLPLLAEVVSGARSGREAIVCYQTLLADQDTAQQIQRVIVFGQPTLTREAASLLADAAREVVVVDAHTGEHAGPKHAHVVADVRLDAAYDQEAARDWLARWIAADRRLLAERTTEHQPDTQLVRQHGYRELNEYARRELAAKRETLTRALLVESVWRASWPHDRLVVAASRLVRELDRVAPPRPVRIHANRGVAGIDGTVGTARGIARASQQGDSVAAAAGVTRVLLGDLALLRDAGSLLKVPGEPEERLQLFVANDYGGSLFASLEVRQVAGDADFRRVVTAPHAVDLEQLAGAYGWTYRRIVTRGELESLLTARVTGCELIEVRFTAVDTAADCVRSAAYDR